MTQTVMSIGADHFSRLIAQLPVILWSTDTTLHVTSRYGGGLAAFGMAAGTPDGSNIADFTDPNDLATVRAAHQTALRGKSASYETRFRGRTLTSTVEPLCDGSGDVVGVVGFAVDVTERREVESALRESEARLRTIFESEPECVMLVDQHGHLMEMNPAGLAIVEAQSGDVLRGRPVVDLVAPEHRAAFGQLHRRVFAGDAATLEFEIIGLGGKRSWLATHAVPLRDSTGAIYALLGIARDISRRRIAERALIESEERFCKAFYANALPLTITRMTDDMILDANEALTTLINRSRDEIVGRTTVALGIMDATHRAAVMETLKRTGVVSDIALELRTKGGVPRTGLLSLVRIEIGGQDCALGTYRDITEAKRAEEQLRASRAALRSLATRQQDIREDERTRIAREIHDSLGQALTALKLQLAAAQDAASREAPALGGRLHETAVLVDDLVKSVRRIASELRPPILDQLGLPAALEWLAQDFSRRTGIQCKASILATNAGIKSELGTALFRIVQEALTNALRHAGASCVTIELGLKSGCVTLEINDDGRGITEAGTTGPRSLGILGMRERAAALGGVLEVAPRQEGGTRVAAWFPPPVEPPPPVSPS